MPKSTTRRLVALLLVTSCCLVGCWDQDEITSLAPVAAIGLDVGSQPGLLRVTCQLTLPEAGGGGAGAGTTRSRLRVLTTESESLVQAFAILQSQTRRRHFFLHLDHVVFGAELARNGLGTALEALHGWSQIRGSTLVFVAEGTAEAVLHAHSGIGQNPANDVAHIIRSASSAPVARKTTLNDMINALAHPGSTSLTLPILGLRPLALSSGDDTPPSGVGQDGEQFMEVALKGTALFDRDRCVAELDIRETQTLAVLAGAAKQGMSTIPSPINAEGKIAPQYENIQVAYRIEEKDDGGLKVTTKIKLDVRLVEVHGGYDPSLSQFRPIEMAVEEDVTTRVAAFFAKLQSYGLDSVNIGQRIKQQKPKLWKSLQENWREVYPTIEFVVEPKAQVRTVGLMKMFRKLGR